MPTLSTFTQKFNYRCSSCTMFWIIIFANYIFSLYTFPCAHSKDDDECDNDLIGNGWIFNTPSLSTLFNSSSTFVFLNNSASSSCLCVCSLLCASFSLAIFYNFSMAICALMLLWIPKLWKHTQLLTTNVNCFQRLPCFFVLEHPAYHIPFFTYMPFLY
jgi:hypothetical protein